MERMRKKTEPSQINKNYDDDSGNGDDDGKKSVVKKQSQIKTIWRRRRGRRRKWEKGIELHDVYCKNNKLFSTPYTECVFNHICHILQLVNQYLNSSNKRPRQRKHTNDSTIIWVNEQTRSRCTLTGRNMLKAKNSQQIPHSTDNWISILHACSGFIFNFYPPDFVDFWHNKFVQNQNVQYVLLNPTLHSVLNARCMHSGSPYTHCTLFSCFLVLFTYHPFAWREFR